MILISNTDGALFSISCNYPIRILLMEGRHTFAGQSATLRLDQPLL